MIEVPRDAVVAETRVHDGQSLSKVYKSCSPMRLAEEPGRYAIVRLDADGR